MEGYYKEPEPSSPYYGRYRRELEKRYGKSRREKSALGRFVRRLSLAALLSVSPLHETGRIREAPLDPRFSFAEGISFLQSRARTADSEEMAAYVVKDEQGAWVLSQRGEETWVRIKFSELLEAAAKFLEGERGGVRDGNTARICFFHTHPLQAGWRKKFLTSDERKIAERESSPPTLPPSITDLGELVVEGAYRGKPVHMMEGVVDARGVYYYRPFPEEKFAESYPQEFEVFHKNRALAEQVTAEVARLLETLSAAELEEGVRRDAEEELSKWGGQPSEEQLRRLVVRVVMSRPESSLRARVVRARTELAVQLSQWDAMSRERMAHFNRAYTAWVNLSRTYHGALTQTEAYGALKKAYRLFGVELRYTEDPEKEAPCAGPDSLKEEDER